MPQPNTTAQRADLGMVAYEYMLDAAQRGFIGLNIFPVFDVTEQSADYPVIPIEALLKTKDTSRSRRGNYNRDDYEFEFGTYACIEHGWEEPVFDDEAKIYKRFYDLEEVAVKRAVDILLRDHEKRVATEVFNTSNLGNGAVTTEWDTSASCTPYDDVNDAKVTAYNTYGIMPNSISMSWEVAMNVLKSDDFRNSLQYTMPVERMNYSAKVAALKDFFDVTYINIGNGLYDSAKKGQSKSLASIWDDEYVLLHSTVYENDIRTSQLGRTFLYTPDSPDIMTTEQYREDQTRANIYRVRHHTDEEFIQKGAGYLLTNITT
jgi:hypothetical protein